jgi:hypothetical protein
MPAMILFVFMVFASFIYLIQRVRGSQTLEKRLNASPFERAFSLYLAILVGMYVYVLTTALEPFRCLEQPDRTLTLVASPYLDCFDTQWSDHWVSIGFGLAYMVFIPTFLVTVLWSYRHSMDTNKFQWRFGLLTSKYKRQYYWWSLYLVAKKIFLVMLIDLTNDYTVHFRSFLVLLMLIAALVIESLCKPRKYNHGASKFISFG